MRADLSVTVAELRAFAHSPDLDVSERLREAAVAYAHACQEANARLARCASLLQRGLRSEALHLAQAEPDLLDLVAELDFPERGMWEVIAANNDLPVPPPLDVAAAQQLNQAYALELPLEQLLRQHRLLALSRAPLGQRLLVLRRIAELDLTNPVWPADIRTFEEARLKELRGEFARAAEELDAVTLGRLRHELTGFAWSAPPPPDLVARVEQTHRRAEIAEARAELSRLESRLSAAAAARDVEEARRLRDQIDRVARDAALPPDDPALRRLRFPLAWVDEQDRKDADREALRRELGTLTGMLDGATPLPELEAQYLLVNSLCDAVPAEVERQYRARVGELRARRQRRRILAASGSVLAVVLLLGVIALWYTRAAHARRARDVERQLQTYLDNRQTPRARALYDEVARREPSVAEDPRVVAQRQRLEREEELDRDRAARFDAAYKEALEIPPGDPRESVKFQELERLATTPEQRTGLARLREERDQLARRARERLEEETLEQLRKVSEELTRLPASATDPAKLAAVRKRLAELERQVAGARAGSGGLGEHVRQWLTAAENQARERRQALDACERQLRQIDAITLALKKEDLGRFAELARGYARDFAGTPRANAFASTFKEYPAWEAVADWNRLCRERKVGVFQRLSCDEARAQLPELEQYLAEHAEALGANPGLFPPELVPRYARFIRAMAARRSEAEPESGAEAEWRRIFADRLITGLWCVETTDGKVYYLPEKPDLQGISLDDSFPLRHLVTYDAKVRTDFVRREKMRLPAEAPQSLLARQVHNDLLGLRDDNWDAVALKVMDRVRTQEKLDPVLAVLLLRRVALTAGKGSALLEEELAGFGNAVEGAKLDLTVPWMDPDRQDADRVRRAAREFLRALGEFEPLAEKVRDRQAALARDLAVSRRVPAGWLLRDAEAGWQFRQVFPGGEGEYELAVLDPDPGGQGLGWRVIGEWSGGRARVGPGRAGLVEGRVVFAREAPRP